MKRLFAVLAMMPVGLLMLSQGAATAANPGVRAVLKPENARKLAPAFRLPDASGRSVLLAKYRGKVVLLNFWATECGGCRVEIPWFTEFDHGYRSKGFQAIGASMDVVYEGLKGPEEGWARIKPFETAHAVAYPILMADDQTTKAYGVDELPTTFLIDKRGRIAAAYKGLVERGNVETNLRMLLRER